MKISEALYLIERYKSANPQDMDRANVADVLTAARVLAMGV